METYFNLNYEFNITEIHQAIARRLPQKGSDYICVADGVIVDNANRNPEYLKVVNSSMFSICDSSLIPLYIKWIYGIQYNQYCGSQIFIDIIKSQKYRMAFIGSTSKILEGLKETLIPYNSRINEMLFYELPYKPVNQFDYAYIAKVIEKSKADIIWVSLGAPKQEIFMNNLKPYLNHGIMIAVGAAFKFYSEKGVKRAPRWMIKMHMEFIHRIFMEPKKQIKRCWSILNSLPHLLYSEWKKSKCKANHQ